MCVVSLSRDLGEKTIRPRIERLATGVICYGTGLMSIARKLLYFETVFTEMCVRVDQ